jgi:catechol 2,3-dioxygenase-like lactoylglutathione lyase family enzyme
MNPITDIAYARLAAPDLDVMEDFLTEFGLQRAERTDAALFMRGVGGEALAHVTERGEKRDIGFALKVAAYADLAEAAEKFGKTVEARHEPGGGHCVILHDPDGNQVELVHGMVSPASAELRAPHLFNPGMNRARFNAVIRTDTRPAHVLRLGHIAVHTPRIREMIAFYCGVLGMQISDTYYAGETANVMAAFLHCGLGETFVDHHTIALIGDGRSGFEHTGFEVLDLDDLMVGNRHLLALGKWRHSWGIGRHRDGSQIFDYWRDPFGNKIEHWTDGDLVNDSYAGTASPFSPELAADQLAQWGPALTPDFMA